MVSWLRLTTSAVVHAKAPTLTGGPPQLQTVVSHDSNGVHYLSKEASATQGPRLTVTTTSGAPNDAGSGGSVGTGGFGNAGGINASGGSSGTTPAGGTDAADDGGCGCRTHGGSSGALALFGASALLLFGARRHRR